MARRVSSDDKIGDIYAQMLAYDAMFSSLIGDPSFVRHKNSTFTDLFASLCSSTDGAEEGCSLFAINIYGGDDRTLSIYEYQVSVSIYFICSLLSFN